MKIYKKYCKSIIQIFEKKKVKKDIMLTLEIKVC